MIRHIRVMSTSVPESAAAQSVVEKKLPTGRTGDGYCCVRVNTPTTSSMVAGIAMTAGLVRTVPLQLLRVGTRPSREVVAEDRIGGDRLAQLRAVRVGGARPRVLPYAAKNERARWPQERGRAPTRAGAP
jgi:hypothetical protein